MRLGGPCLAHGVGVERDIHPRVVPGEHSASAVARHIGQLLVVFVVAAHGAVHGVHVGVVPLHLQRVTHSHAQGEAEVEVQSLHACLGGIDIAPYKQVVGYADYLVLYLINIYIAAHRGAERGQQLALPCQARVPLACALGFKVLRAEVVVV